LNVEEVEKYDDKDWMQKWESCDEEVLIEEEEGRNFMQRNLDTPRVREEVILGIDDILGSFKVLFIEMLEGGNPECLRVGLLDDRPMEVLDPWKELGGQSEKEMNMTEIPFLQSLRTSPEDAFEEFLRKLRNKISSEFNAATPTLQFLRGEGASIFNPRIWDDCVSTRGGRTLSGLGYRSHVLSSATVCLEEQ
jgi:hypothetical protein